MRRIVSLAACCLLAASAARSQPQTPSVDPLAAVEQTMAAAEASLRENELQIAESRYRSALVEGWMLLGAVHASNGRLTDAREAFRRASTSAVETGGSLHSLALVHLQLGEAGEAMKILSQLARANPRDVATRRLFAQALLADGHPDEAVQELEEARGTAPDDPELAFALASGYLRLKKLDAAERLFAEVIKAKPLPQTYVLIGRTYRDSGHYDRARASLLTALKKNPRVPRAHYYLGTLSVLEEGVLRLDEAIAEFRQELQLSPADPVTNLRLGMALVEAQRAAEALPALRLAARAEPVPALAFYYLGRSQLALDRTAEALVSLRKALQLVQQPPVDETRAGHVHYQLGVALRKTGAFQEAAEHFAEAQRLSERRVERSREQLARYLEDTPDPQSPIGLGASPLTIEPPAARRELQRRITVALTRVYFNLGIMQAQANRFLRAVEFFEQAALLDPQFPQVQYSLGVAYFNAKQYQKASGPLAGALAARPDDIGTRRMLALSYLNAEVYGKAADLLRDDPQRESDPSLQYAYGVALVRSDRGAEAEAIFTRLLAAHGDHAEMNVVLGQAHAQQGDFEAAVRTLHRALQIKPDVAEANATLGVIYFKQGRLSEAAEALRSELKSRPDDVSARYHLAAVLDLDGRRDEALSLVRSVIRVKPDYADARYLLGKILLAQGDAAAAVEQLEAAARHAPEDANIYYQLGQAYQKLGRSALAEDRLERYRQLKDKRRGRTP
ncbi:MAG: tetratricopeptide repeat protein [Vicinamibacterales bacterium]